MIPLLILVSFAGLAFGSFHKYPFSPGGGPYSKSSYYPGGGPNSRYSYLSGGVSGPFTSPGAGSGSGSGSGPGSGSGSGSRSRPGSFPRNPLVGGSRFEPFPKYPGEGPSFKYPFPQNEGPYLKFPYPQHEGQYPKYPFPQEEPYPKYPFPQGDDYYPTYPYPPKEAPVLGPPFPWQGPSGPYPKYPNPWDDVSYPGYLYPPGLGEDPYCLPNIKCWTAWIDHDDPDQKGDWELLSLINNDRPGLVCPNATAIDVTTVRGKSVASAGEVIFKNDPKGFICRNEDQPDGRCCDYRVRFACHAPFCDRVCNWTRFFDRDDCFGTGDYELLNDLRVDYPGEICDDPIAIEAVTVGTSIPAIHTGDWIHTYCPSKGFVCRAEDQPSRRCHDYKVRFGCPCR